MCTKFHCNNYEITPPQTFLTQLNQPTIQSLRYTPSRFCLPGCNDKCFSLNIACIMDDHCTNTSTHSYYFFLQKHFRYKNLHFKNCTWHFHKSFNLLTTSLQTCVNNHAKIARQSQAFETCTLLKKKNREREKSLPAYFVLVLRPLEFAKDQN